MESSINGKYFVFYLRLVMYYKYKCNVQVVESTHYEGKNTHYSIESKSHHHLDPAVLIYQCTWQCAQTATMLDLVSILEYYLKSTYGFPYKMWEFLRSSGFY